MAVAFLLVILIVGVWRFAGRSIEGTWLADLSILNEYGVVTLMVTPAKETNGSSGIKAKNNKRKTVNMKMSMGAYKPVSFGNNPQFRYETSGLTDLGTFEEIKPDTYQIISNSGEMATLIYDKKDDTLTLNINVLFIPKLKFKRIDGNGLEKAKERLQSNIKNRYKGQQVIFLPDAK